MKNEIKKNTKQTPKKNNSFPLPLGVKNPGNNHYFLALHRTRTALNLTARKGDLTDKSQRKELNRSSSALSFVGF